MQRMINTIATCAAAAALMSGLWQDWSLLTTVKRMLIGYLGFFFLGSLMVLTIRAVPMFDKAQKSPETVEPRTNKNPKGNRAPEKV